MPDSIEYTGKNAYVVERWLSARGGYANYIGRPTPEGVVSIFRVITHLGEQVVEPGGVISLTEEGFTVENKELF